jgi:hypothetical protein
VIAFLVGLSMWYKASVRSVVAGLEYLVRAVQLCMEIEKITAKKI